MLPDQDMPQSYRACWEEQQVNQRAVGMRRLHHASNVKQEKRKLERPPLRLGLGIPLLLRNRQVYLGSVGAASPRSAFRDETLVGWTRRVRTFQKKGGTTGTASFFWAQSKIPLLFNVSIAQMKAVIGNILITNPIKCDSKKKSCLPFLSETIIRFDLGLLGFLDFKDGREFLLFFSQNLEDGVRRVFGGFIAHRLIMLSPKGAQ